jgi:hypothetical protein
LFNRVRQLLINEDFPEPESPNKRILKNGISGIGGIRFTISLINNSEYSFTPLQDV